MSSDEFIVTPWHVEGDIDYDKLKNLVLKKYHQNYWIKSRI